MRPVIFRGLRVLAGFFLFTLAAQIYVLMPTGPRNLSDADVQGAQPASRSEPGPKWEPPLVGNYSVQPFLAEGALWTQLSDRPWATCLALHATLSHAHLVSLQAGTWDGPVSAALFAAGPDVHLLQAYVSFLRRCRPHVSDKVSFHLVWLELEEDQENVTTTSTTATFLDELENDWADCNETDEAVARRLSRLQTQPVGEHLLYPQNLVRNAARLSCQTNLTICPDADMLPAGRDLPTGLAQLFSREPPCRKCAYVLPVFEVDSKVAALPKTKSELYRLSLKHLARPYHWSFFKMNQKCVDPIRWLKLKSKTTEVSIAYPMRYYWMSEPVYVADNTDLPPFDEMFVGYGYTRNTQAYEMFAKGWRFFVLDNAFLVHRGFQTGKRPAWRIKQSERNRGLVKKWVYRVAMVDGSDPLHLARKYGVRRKGA